MHIVSAKHDKGCIKMDAKEIERRLKVMVGSGSHGWQTKAAKMLGVTTRTIARNLRTPTQEFYERLRRKETGVDIMSQDELAELTGGLILGRSVNEGDDAIYLVHHSESRFVFRSCMTGDGPKSHITWIDKPKAEEIENWIAVAKGMTQTALYTAVEEESNEDIAREIIDSGQPASTNAKVLSLMRGGKSERVKEIIALVGAARADRGRQ